MPRVSVIVPTYNRLNTLKRAIQSVLDQTCQDFEIIVVDDASTESPEKLVHFFKDSRIRYFRHPKNKGANAARNTGINCASGEYIAFLDSDDEWLPEKLECQLKSFNILPEQVGVHYAGLTAISSEGTVVGHRTPLASGDILSKLLTGNCVGPLSTVMVRRSALEYSGLFDEKLSSSQDWDLYIRIAKHHHFSFTAKPMIKYHLSNDSITKNLKAKANGRRMLIGKYEDDMKKDPLAFCRQLTKTGHYYCRAGLIDEGRSEFARALRANPLSLQAYFFLICSLFGPTCYNQLVFFRHRIFSKS